MFIVYILKSLKSGRYYIGQTNDLDRRLSDHNRGKNKSTKGHKPFKCVYKESYKTREEAVTREKKIKSYKGGEAFRQLIFEQ